MVEGTWRPGLVSAACGKQDFAEVYLRSAPQMASACHVQYLTMDKVHADVSKRKEARLVHILLEEKR